MSCDVCPFCGKTYKRLKSHLPHCKAAANSKTPPGRNDAAARQTKTKKSSPLVSDESLLAAATPQSKESKKASRLVTAPAASSQSGAPSSPSQSVSQSSASAKKKKKQKLSDLIKAAAAAASSSSTSSSAPLTSFSAPLTSSSAPLTSTQSPPAAPNSPKPKKKRDPKLTEDPKTSRVPHRGLVGGNEPPSEDLAGPGSSGTAAPTGPGPDRGDSVRLSADLRPPAAAKVKLSRTSVASANLDSEAGQSGDDFSGTSRGTEDSSISHLTSKAGSGHQVARITLRDAKATLGRNSSRRADLLHQFVPPGSGAEVRTVADLSRVSLQAEPNLLPNISSSLLPLVQAKGSNRQPPTRHVPPQASQATPNPPPRAVSLNEALHTISPILSPFHRRHPLPAGPHLFPGGAQRQTEPGGGSRTWSTSGGGATGSPEPQRLGQVTLKELPDWLAGRAPRRPRDLLNMLQKGWQWYYRRYIDVKKGGVGGLGMLLAGYCVLSYAWSYPHLKQHRWRKHH
ncbi:uncharacterized protein LOC142893228 isoform X2 [Nelusetta ayraudi]|uniref:uncharacterized protein LOC142893228 isoform X2 n=1 Tax=Nelusetta ayraudi TaxID=303726 RepID=UPI003F71B58F